MNPHGEKEEIHKTLKWSQCRGTQKGKGSDSRKETQKQQEDSED